MAHGEADLMTGTTLLERPTEKFAEAGGFAVEDPADKTPIKLGGAPKMAPVDQITQPPATPTPEPRVGSLVPPGWKAFLDLNRLEGSQGATITFSSRFDDAKGDSSLRFSLVALSQAASGHSDDPGDWLDAASVLKRDAVRVRNSSSLGRHASVLLTLADALTFTLPSDPTLKPGATDALKRGLSVLTEPFISTEAEKGLMIDLLSRGWNLAPAFEGKSPGA